MSWLSLILYDLKPVLNLSAHSRYVCVHMHREGLIDYLKNDSALKNMHKYKEKASTLVLYFVVQTLNYNLKANQRNKCTLRVFVTVLPKSGQEISFCSL